MKSLIVLLTFPMILSGLLLSSSDYGSASTIDTSIPNNEVASRLGEANNSSASTTIIITMYALPDE